MRIVLLVLFLLVSCSSSDKTDKKSDATSDVNANVEIVGGDLKSDSLNSEIPEGYGKSCVDDYDCEDYGLKCFKSKEDDLNAFCSTECESDSDCPGSLKCGVKGEYKVCKFPSYCDKCETDSDCGPDGRCINDDSGTKFCTYRCVDDSDCIFGSFCKNIGTDEKNPLYCFPKLGVCVGNGGQCEPCRDDDDCNEGFVCFYSDTFPDESFCAKKCLKNPDCDEGYVCAEPKKGLKICLKTVDDKPIDTCYVGVGEFCDKCEYNFQCRSNLCFTSPAGEKFCSKPCPGVYQNDKCYPGTFCIKNAASEGEDNVYGCAPPNAYKCIGFKQCLGVQCQPDEVCVNGFCQKKKEEK